MSEVRWWGLKFNSCPASWQERVKRVSNADNGRNLSDGREIAQLTPPKIQIRKFDNKNFSKRFWSEVLYEKWAAQLLTEF